MVDRHGRWSLRRRARVTHSKALGAMRLGVCCSALLIAGLLALPSPASSEPDTPPPPGDSVALPSGGDEGCDPPAVPPLCEGEPGEDGPPPSLPECEEDPDADPSESTPASGEPLGSDAPAEGECVETDEDQDGFAVPVDCDDQDAEVHPEAQDVPGDGRDGDCSLPSDADDDGFAVPEDCDDANVSIHPLAVEVPGGTSDENCDGVAADPDQDGATPPEDCDDADPSVGPAMPERPGNEVDENCDGEAADRDGDGASPPRDCDDRDYNRGPAAVDVPDNGVDEDCSGGDATRRPAEPSSPSGPSVPPVPAEPSAPPGATVASAADAVRLLAPFPVIRIRGSFDRRGARIDLLSIQAPARARVEVRCVGAGCPARPVAFTVGPRPRTVRLRRFERRFRPGAVLEVRVTRDGEIGKSTRFKVRRGAAPIRRDLCLASPTSRAGRCPSF